MKIIAHSRFARLGFAGLGIILATFIIHALASSVAVAQPAATDKVVSYKVVKMRVNPTEAASDSFIETQLNSYGMAGWHLVAIDHSFYIFSK
jgi:hypothetical protein